MSKKTLAGLLCAFALGAQAQDTTSLDDNRLENLLTLGKVKGTLGSYWEYVERKESRYSDTGWWTAYLDVNVESKSYNGFNLGAEFFGHMEMWESGSGEPYTTDVEDEARESMPQLYLRYKSDSFEGKLGRIDSMGAHLDDNRYEGFIGKCTAVENMTFMLGAIRSFAEIDYDDAEVFGGSNKSAADMKNLNDGEAGEYMIFAEAIATLADKAIRINPYVYAHEDYANVIGADLKAMFPVGDAKVGGKVEGHQVDARQGDDDAFNWRIAALAEVGKSLSAEIGTTGFGGDATDEALNRPVWFKDYMYVDDQSLGYAGQGAERHYVHAKYKIDEKAWASLTYVYGTLEVGPNTDLEYEDIELQVGYKLTQNFDVNLRLFDVNIMEGSDGDYFKTEGRVRYKF